MILVTGALGLIGRSFCARLEREGLAYRPFDLRRSALEDIRDPARLEAALDGASGIVHLAAVSRVVWGERDPETCWNTNVLPLQRLLEAGVAQRGLFIVFGSSREVYGQAARFPVTEEDPLEPVNVYGRSKLAGEAVIAALREQGMIANLCRFSSVFGSTHDHADRVAMAFAAAAAHGGTIRIDGRGNTFDFTSVEDAVEGLFRVTEASVLGERLPPVHFASGRGTSLAELAEIARGFARSKVDVVDAPPRTFDVSHFVGDPSRARTVLGWQARADLEKRFGQLVEELCAAA